MCWLLSEEPDNNKEDFLDTPNRLSERPLLETFNGASTPTTNEKLSSSKEPKMINNRITPFGQRINKFVSQFTYNAQNQVNRVKKSKALKHGRLYH